MNLSQIDLMGFPGRLRLSIRARLVLMVLAVGLPFLVYMTINTARQVSIEREHCKEQTLAIARLMQSRLDEMVGTINQLLLTTSYSTDLSGLDPEKTHLLIQKLNNNIPAFFHDVAIWDAQGENIGALQQSDPARAQQRPGIGNRKFFKETLAGNDLNIEGPVRTLPARDWSARFGRTIQHDDRAIGIVTATIKLEALKKLLDPQGSLPPGSVVTVLDQNGVVIARSADPEQWIGRSPATSQIYNPLKSEGSMESVGFDGVNRVSAYIKVTSAPWILFVGIPLDTALASSRARLYENMALGGAALVVALLLASLFGQSIASPLERLTRDATLIGQGRLAHRSEVRASGEMSLLAGSLNQMARAIQERTLALERSEEWLQQMTDNMPALVSYLDRELRFRFVNRAYQDWLGVQPSKLIGLSVREFYGEETYAGIKAHMEAALGGAKVSYERTFKTPTGPKYAHITLVPQIDVRQGVLGLYVLITDITTRKQIEMEHAKVQERLSLALEASNLALFDWDMRINRVYCSAMWSVMCGGTAVESSQTPEELMSLVHPDDIAQLKSTLVATLKGECSFYNVEHRVRTLKGDWLWIRSRGRVIERDARGMAVRLAGTNVDINASKQAEQRLKHLAEVDALTQLPNRACFLERLDQALQRAEQRKSSMAVLFIDVDHFKLINDTFGHETGDFVLQSVATRLSAQVRSTDTVARLGGDEFTIILNELHSIADAEDFARKVIEAIGERVELSENELRLTVSIGIAFRSRQDWNGPTLLRNADQALYEVKRRGRNGYFAYTGNEFPDLKLDVS